MQADVLVIGGGLAGLTCAIALGDSGLSVAVLERGANLGGRARSWIDTTSGDAVDIGPHVFLTEYRNMFRLLDRLGTRDRLVWHLQKLMTMVDGRTPVPLPTVRLPPPLHFVPSLVRLARAPTLTAKDVWSNTPIARLALHVNEQDLAALDRLPADAFLRQHGVSPRFIDWFWATTSMSILNVPLDKCSAGALMRFYRIMIGRDLHIGFAGDGLGDLYAEQAARAIAAHGGGVLRRTEVKRVEIVDDAALSVVLADGSQLSARFIVSAIPAHELAPLLPDSVRRHPCFSNLNDFEPSPYISTYIWFTRKLTREQFWVRLWSPTTLNYDFYDLSNIRLGWSERPSVIASNIIYSHRAHHLSDAEIIKATIREIADVAPEVVHAPVRHAVVHRIPMAIACPYPGNERKRPAARTPVRNFFLAGDWTHTGLPSSMESACRSGWLVAEEIMKALGRPQSFAIEPPASQGVAGMVYRMANWRRAG
jgi:squalene-associated FAD-dependent desaturase